MTPAELKAQCATDMERLLVDFERQPDQDLFFDLGTAAEILVLCGDIESTRPLRERLSRAVLVWIRRGLLDDALFAKASYLYHASLFCYFASRDPDFRPEDADYTRRLLASGLAGRNELPVISMELISICLAAAGIASGPTEVGTRDLRLVVDRRVLRSRSDDYDILTLTMVAQISRLGGRAPDQLPRLFPQTLLVQAIRAGHINWVAVLTFLCATVYGLPTWLRDGATEALTSYLQKAEGLLPAPDGSLADNDHVQRAERGLRLRSSIASFALLHE